MPSVKLRLMVNITYCDY